MSDQYPYPYQPMPPAPQGWPQGWPPPPPPVAPKSNRGAWIGLGTFVAAALVLGGVTFATSRGGETVAGSGTQLEVIPGGGSSGGAGGSQPGNGSGQASGRSGTASATAQVGVVTIVSTLKYQRAQSAGTGMILSSDGDVLTNNHVIRGATSVTVTVETTGRSYRATVVGTAPAKDVAVLKLQDASGLQTAKLADSASGVQVGDSVTGVGNAGGTGRLTAASGKVTGLDQSITASDETGQSSERLMGLIEVDARIISGDSGGPLYDDSGEIIGVNTAASSTNTSANTAARAYAIPIENAIAIADQIDTGVETTGITIGYPAFLGINLDGTATDRVRIKAILDPSGPAARAGITAGSVITGIDDTTATTPDSLRTELATMDPGDKVKVSWTDASGQSRSATLTLAAGPAD